MARVLRLLDSISPVRGDLRGDALTLRAFRLSCVFAGVLLMVFGWFYDQSGEPVVDPWPLRIGVSLATGVALALSFTSATVRRHIGAAHQGVIYALMAYCGWLIWANSLSPDYAVGFLLTFVLLALSHGLAFTSRRPLLRYLLASTAIALAVVAATPAPGVWTPAFVTTVVAAAAALYISLAARSETVRELQLLQAQHTAAEALGGDGSWVIDLERGRTTWSDGARRLYGVPPVGPVPVMTTLVHPDDRPRAVEAKSRLLREGGTAEVTFRAIALDGTERVIQSTSRAETDPDGRVVRLYGTLHDVTAQVAREAELRRALDRAEEATRAKGAFLANMSHEIRTPLTAIIGFAQLLRDEAGDAFDDLTRPIETGGLRLMDTLNSVLDLARMDAGQGTLDLVPVSAGAEVQGVAEMFGARAAQKGLRLVAEPTDALPDVLADRPALGRVLANLVSNAIKFTDAGEVRLGARRARDGRVEITVSDTGVGMDADFLASLYEPFWQASTGWGRSHEGTGLGLTISDRLVQAMGGTIAVASTPGRGTTFTLTLPAAPAARAGDEATADAQAAPSEAAATALEPAAA